MVYRVFRNYGGDRNAVYERHSCFSLYEFLLAGSPNADANRDSSSARDGAWRLVDATLMHRSSRQTTRSNFEHRCVNIKKQDISYGYPLSIIKYKERETGIEPATPSLARRCSTAEPLAHFVVSYFVPTTCYILA